MRFDYAAYDKMVALERKYTAPKTTNKDTAVEPIEKETDAQETDTTEEGGADDDAGDSESAA